MGLIPAPFDAAIEPYLIWARLIAVAIGALAIAGLIWWGASSFNHMRDQAARVPALEQAVKAANATVITERKSVAKAQKVSNDLQTDLTTIRAERDRLRTLPARVVRVYVPTRPPLAGSAAAGGSGAATPAGVALASPTGFPAGLSGDIGRDLYGIVDDADAREATLGAQVRRLQEAYAVAVEACNGVAP